MAVLSDHQIHERLQSPSDELNIQPVSPQEQIQPASVDLRIEDSLREGVHESEKIETNGDELTFKPGTHYLGSTLETVRLPDDVAGQVQGRSSIGRLGLQIHTTAGWIDPGFKGDITLEIYNLTDESLTFPVGQRICQLVLFELSEPAEVPYDKQSRSKYIGQSGATPSRIEQEDLEFQND